ncbi:hypothetical protein H2200_006486 [Cladophialophora chaetospira]|uniref:Uncharacterized protein n=1 Tax=Cladophialophora chaetospira TaxID=386627 RepID=A0AA39CHQ7_9EURO|nr:hypothetical protein H2200_006486 [Cladophialophora chaetospira]
MVDVASIVLAVVSLVGAIGAAVITGWFTFYSDYRKRLSESEKLVAKYRDPLLLAASDLQSRLFNLVDQGLLNFFDSPDPRQRDILTIYTCFLVGQYLAWTNILRRQAQFVCFSTDKQNKDLADILSAISHFFATDGKYGPGQPFLLWRGQQMAIGEIMTIKEDNGDDKELVCLGYAAFTKKMEDETFRQWFEPVIEGITILFEQQGQASGADHRLRHLQHLLIDLISILDTKQLRAGGANSRRCRKSPKCTCTECRSAQPNPQPGRGVRSSARPRSGSKV